MRRFELALLVTLAVSAGTACFLRRAPPPSLVDGSDASVMVNGVALAFHVRGHGPVCLVHPGGPGLGWAYLRMPELERKLTLVYLEPVGSGRSGRLASRDGYTMKRYVDDLEDFADALGLGRFYLLGHAHGGMVAQEYAIRRSNRLKGLILFGTVARGDAEWALSIEQNTERWFGKQPWFAAVQAAMVDEGSATSDEELLKAVKRQTPSWVADYAGHKARVDLETARLDIALDPNRAPPMSWDVRKRLASVNAPTLIVSAERDVTASERFIEELEHALPRSRSVLIPRAGHMAHWERPEAVAEPIADFVLGLEHASDERR